ncbi:MAG: hypothetical protein WD380_07440 [Gaiellaceae bacterium]
MSRRWERIVVVLGVCLPIPLSAASGLTIPLPAVVERIAASLVPFADAATLESNQALASGVRGSIVRLAQDGPLTTSGPVVVGSRSHRNVEPQSAPGRSDVATLKDEGGGTGRPRPDSGPTGPTNEPTDYSDGPAGADTGPSRDPKEPGSDPREEPSDEPGQEPQDDPAEGPVKEPSQEPQDEPGQEPEDEAGPVEDTVNEVGETTERVVDEVTGTTEGVVDEVTGTVDDVDTGELDGAVDKIVPPLGR